MPIGSDRSGFLSQLFRGRPADVKEPAKFGDDFFATVLMYADTRIESTLFYAMTRHLSSGGSRDRRPAALTSKHVYSYADEPADEPFFGFKMPMNMKQAIFGISRVARYIDTSTPLYFSNKRITLYTKENNSFIVFHNIRDFIFALFKLLDTIVRLPVIVAAFFQVLLERTGWALQSNTAPIPLRWAGQFVGFLLTGLSVVASAVVSVGKILAEFVRMPLAIVGGAAGLVFGAVTALSTSGNKLFASPGQCILGGMLDGIRPFAPALADYITFYADVAFKKSDKPPVPWGTILGIAAGIALIVVASVFSAGAVPALGAIIATAFQLAGMGGVVSAVIAPLQVAFGAAWPVISAVGVLGAAAKAGSTIWNVGKAFMGDCVSLAKSAYNAFNAYREKRALTDQSPEAANAVLVEMEKLSQTPVIPPSMHRSPLYDSNTKHNPLYQGPDSGTGTQHSTHPSSTSSANDSTHTNVRALQDQMQGNTLERNAEAKGQNNDNNQQVKKTPPVGPK